MLLPPLDLQASVVIDDVCFPVDLAQILVQSSHGTASGKSGSSGPPSRIMVDLSLLLPGVPDPEGSLLTLLLHLVQRIVTLRMKPGRRPRQTAVNSN